MQKMSELSFVPVWNNRGKLRFDYILTDIIFAIGDRQSGSVVKHNLYGYLQATCACPTNPWYL